MSKRKTTTTTGTATEKESSTSASATSATKNKSKGAQNKTTNPLYAITEKGKVVKEVRESGWKGIKEYWNMNRLMSLWQYLWDLLSKNLGAGMALQTLQKIVDKWVEDLKILAHNSQTFWEMAMVMVNAQSRKKKRA